MATLVISASDARALVTQALIDVYDEEVRVLGFGKSFFKEEVSRTLQVSIEVRRNTELIATEVIRGSLGDRVSVSRSSQKIFIPPFYKRYFDATELDLYDRVWGTADGRIDIGVFTLLLGEIQKKNQDMVDTIDRAYEKQCWDVLETGIVSLEKSIDIDYKRKAASLVDLGGGNYWDNQAVKPFDVLFTGGEFIRNKGKAQGTRFNLIMGNDAYDLFEGNDNVKERADNRRFVRDNLQEAQMNAVGGNFMGTTSSGRFTFDIWTYGEVFDTKTQVNIPYKDPRSIIILPQVPRFKFAFAAVPRLFTQGGPIEGKFAFGEFTDERLTAHEFDVKSAGLAVPVAIDTIFTATVAP